MKTHLLVCIVIIQTVFFLIEFRQFQAKLEKKLNKKTLCGVQRVGFQVTKILSLVSNE
jgi:hypothetical protein